MVVVGGAGPGSDPRQAGSLIRTQNPERPLLEVTLRQMGPRVGCTDPGSQLRTPASLTPLTPVSEPRTQGFHLPQSSLQRTRSFLRALPGHS